MRRFLITLCLLILSSGLVKAQIPKEFTYPETWMQITPAVFDLSAEYLGLQSKHNVKERAVALVAGYAAETAICYCLKYTVREERPDHSNLHSFPSAHTAAAFVGAELIRQDYGTVPGVIFYACGAGVGYGRVYHQRHWWWDTVAGAGVGILSAWIGRWVADSLDLSDKDDIAFGNGTLSASPSIDPVSGTLCASLAFRF